MSLGEEDHISEEPFSSHHIREWGHPHDIPVTWAFITWLRPCLPGFSTVKLLFFRFPPLFFRSQQWPYFILSCKWMVKWWRWEEEGRGGGESGCKKDSLKFGLGLLLLAGRSRICLQLYGPDVQQGIEPLPSEHMLWSGPLKSKLFQRSCPGALMGPLSAAGMVNFNVCPFLSAGAVYLLCCMEASETVDHLGHGHLGESFYLQSWEAGGSLEICLIHAGSCWVRDDSWVTDVRGDCK